jgi:hypothetical protein
MYIQENQVRFAATDKLLRGFARGTDVDSVARLFQRHFGARGLCGAIFHQQNQLPLSLLRLVLDHIH